MKRCVISIANIHLKLKPYIRELFSIVQDGLKTNKHFLLEQAMGTFLDTDWGTYPFVTASTTIPSAASAGLGIPPRFITNVVGVTKAYTTRVGAGPLPTEIHDRVKVRSIGNLVKSQQRRVVHGESAGWIWRSSKPPWS